MYNWICAVQSSAVQRSIVYIIYLTVSVPLKNPEKNRFGYQKWFWNRILRMSFLICLWGFWNWVSD